MHEVALLVIAKAPLPGRVKTRLCPPLSCEHAAELAEAALLDTLEVVAATPASHRVLVFEGDPQRWRPPGFHVLAQRGRGLGERLAAAFDDVRSPALLVGMDTPQLTPQLLLDGMRALAEPDIDAVLGPAFDGGYWSVGLKRANHEVFDNVPMSLSTTYTAQRARIARLGLRIREQPPLRDVDTLSDARAVAAEVPDSRFAQVLAAVA
jgi:rSAM/selenodomain-associated transferase 1